MHPRLLQFGHFALPTYGALVAAGVMVSLLVSIETALLLSLPTQKVWNLALLGIGVGTGGSKLLQILQALPHYGLGALSISVAKQEGFFVVLCGIGLAIAACWLYALRVRLPLGRTADALAPALAIVSSAASIGCLEAGCDYGRPAHVPWAIVFTSPLTAPGTPLGFPLHPTQIYNSLVDFTIFVVLLWLLHRPHGDGQILGMWLFLKGFASFLLAGLRGDGGHGELFGGFLTVVQFIAAVMVILGGILWLHRSEPAQGLHAD